MASSLERRIRDLFRSAPSRGETSELRQGLVSQYAYERKDAIERTIRAMTLGKDVSGLFPDILKNLATHDLDQKKLVYLYLMNYAKTHPELCILAVNTFVRDSEDPNPLVRALAIRTMGCIRVDKMVDFMDVPLRTTLKDENPYVRKTAAICVAKLFDLDPEMCVEQGFLDSLKSLLDDSNPMVIANTVSALAEIQQADPSTHCFEITSHTLDRLLAALNECTEWGRIAILTALAEYKNPTLEEASHIVERVVPQFQHANPSVVLAAVKAVIAHMAVLPLDRQEQLQRKMSSPLVTLLATPPELQYVALRNIRIILQKFPGILERELRVFYCRYNDPLYLKLEKVEIMVNLASKNNCKQLVAELKEYCTEVDIEFVRRSVRALGQTAVQIPESADMVVDTLLDLLDNKVPYVTQEVVVVMRDILRKYPQFEDAIPRLCDSIDELDEPESRAAIVWILGEYAAQIPPVRELLAPFARQFMEEETQTQLQLLTACVKLYVKRPDDGKDTIHELLQTATQKSDNADIRDRAYIYWRVLSSDTDLARKLVLARRPELTSTIDQLPAQLLDELLGELSTLASVYHVSPRTLQAGVHGSGRYGSDDVQRKALEEQRQLAREDNIMNPENLLDLDGDESRPTTSQESGLSILSDIFSTPATAGPSSGTHAGASNPATSQETQDILALFTPQAPPPSTEPLSSAPAPSVPQASSPQTDTLSTTSQNDAESSKANGDLIGLF